MGQPCRVAGCPAVSLGIGETGGQYAPAQGHGGRSQAALGQAGRPPLHVAGPEVGEGPRAERGYDVPRDNPAVAAERRRPDAVNDRIQPSLGPPRDGGGVGDVGLLDDRQQCPFGPPILGAIDLPEWKPSRSVAR